MTTLVLGTVGSLVGGMVGGPIGAQVGWLVGSLLGNLIDPPKGCRFAPRCIRATDACRAAGDAADRAYRNEARAERIAASASPVQFDLFA